MDPPPLDGPRTAAELRAAAGPTVTPAGIGGLEALRVFADVLAPACISVDHPRFLSFVPAAPTEAAILFDLVVGASSIYGGSWLEGGGAVYAENEALRWIADLAGLPAGAGGVFVSGGTAGNLSALVAARWRWRQRAGGRHDRTRGRLLTSAGAHSSVSRRPGDGRRRRRGRPPTTRGRLTGDAPRAPRSTRSTDAERRPVVRRRRHERHHQRRRHRRPRRRRRRRRRARHVDARRRRVRRRRPRRAERPPPLRRHRGRRQLHRRPAQVAVRPVRLVRPALPRPGDRPAGPHPARRVPRRPARRRAGGRQRLERVRLRPPPQPRGPAACRSGSASPPTAPTPTPRPSRRRSPSPGPVPSSSRAAPHLELVVEPELSVVLFRRRRLGRRRSTRRGATASWRAATPS